MIAAAAAHDGNAIKFGKFHPSIERRLIARQAEPPLDQNPRCVQVAQNMPRMREPVQMVMNDNTLDALVYPTWAFPPRLIGDLNTPHRNNSPRLSPSRASPRSRFPWGLCATACWLDFRSSAAHGASRRLTPRREVGEAGRWRCSNSGR